MTALLFFSDKLAHTHNTNLSRIYDRFLQLHSSPFLHDNCHFNNNKKTRNLFILEDTLKNASCARPAFYCTVIITTRCNADALWNQLELNFLLFVTSADKDFTDSFLLLHVVGSRWPISELRPFKYCFVCLQNDCNYDRIMTVCKFSSVILYDSWCPQWEK